MEEKEAKRNSTNVRYDVIMAEFEKTLAQIGHYGAETYGDLNWQKSRLRGGKGPVNHIRKHLTDYRLGEPYDHPEIGTDKKIHLAAIAFNAMMEFWYESQPAEQLKDVLHELLCPHGFNPETLECCECTPFVRSVKLCPHGINTANAQCDRCITLQRLQGILKETTFCPHGIDTTLVNCSECIREEERLKHHPHCNFRLRGGPCNCNYKNS